MAMEDVVSYRFKPGQSGNPKGRPKNRVTSEWLPACLGTKRAKALKNALTQDEIDTWDRILLRAGNDELTAIIKAPDCPMYAKALAMGILADTKNGRTATIDRIRDRQYRTVVRKVELTGKDGRDLNPEPVTVEIIDRREDVTPRPTEGTDNA